jgi:hypothetical protein
MWLPGGMYEHRAAQCRGLARDILNDPVEYVKAEMVIVASLLCPLSHAQIAGWWNHTTILR